MKLSVFSVFDNRAKAFLPPFFMVNSDVARRAFGQCANEVSHQFCQSPHDYCLFEIGEFNDSSGDLMPFSTFVNHGLAVVFKRPVEPVDPAARSVFLGDNGE